MKRGTPKHPKVRALMKRLGLPTYRAVGLLESLWHMTALYAKRGDIGRFTNQEIADDIGWDGDADDMIAALVETRWVDSDSTYRLLIHDWPDHADQTVVRSEEIKKFGFIARQSPSEKLAINASQPTPMPEPCLANALPPVAPRDGKGARRCAFWDAVCELWGLSPVTDAERSRVGRIVRDLKLKLPDDTEPKAAIRRRIEKYRAKFPNAADTPEAVMKHWDSLVTKAASGPSPAEKTRQYLESLRSKA